MSKYVIDIVKLENESFPNDQNIENGSTCYEVDSKKLFVYYKGVWYEQ